jgi:xanthine dehydrogenase accessory factor
VTPELIDAIAQVLASGGRAALVTIVRATGSTPQRVGAKMLVLEDGRAIGTIGGGCYENDALGKARLVLAEGRPQIVQYELNDDLAGESGLVCGGRMEVFIEPVAPPPDLYVVGAGHVGFHLGRFASAIGFRLHVVDDREAFANASRFPEAVEVVVDDIGRWLAAAPLAPRSYVVVVTRGHRHDLEAVRALAAREVAYVGLIGSRAKVARLFEALLEEGVAAEVLRRVHAPIGLDLGAVTPEEIAISILAELIAVRHGRLRYREDQRPDDAPRALKWAPPAVTRTEAAGAPDRT